MQWKAEPPSLKNVNQNSTKPVKENVMRLVTFQLEDEVRLGVLLGKKIIDMRLAYLHYCHTHNQPTILNENFASMLNFLMADQEVWKTAADSIQFIGTEVAKTEDTAKDALFDLQEVTLLAPLPNPGKVICLGGNYPAPGKLTAPDYPVVFLKPTSSITGPGMPICIPEITTNVAYEAELVIVIGKRARNVSKDDAPMYIAGYTLANDLGDRMLEKRTSQWTAGKMFDTFTPLGPALITPDEIPDTHNLPIETWVNDQQVQKGSTGEMFFGVHYLVSYLSTLTTLEPGDIILTGSPKLMNSEPAPSVALKPGDTVRVAIGSLGELINPVREEPK
jgi:acylpyruvate hydrolase